MKTITPSLKILSHIDLKANHSKMLYFFRLKDILMDVDQLHPLGLYALILFYGGKGKIYVDTKQYSVNGVSLLILNPSNISCFELKDCDGYCIFVNPSLLNGFYGQFYNEETEKNI